jgi:hypothetical protein
VHLFGKFCVDCYFRLAYSLFFKLFHKFLPPLAIDRTFQLQSPAPEEKHVRAALLGVSPLNTRCHGC